MTTITQTKERKVWTVSNERVQMILDKSAKPNRTAKKNRWETLKQTVAQIGEFFTDFFPNKQRAVIDEIVYMTAATGIAKMGAATLAKNAEASERTVTTAVGKLKKIGEYIVARIGRAGKYVFIDTKHQNFATIMDFLFGQDASLVASSVAVPVAVPIACPEFPETLVPQGIEVEKQHSNDINVFNDINEIKKTKDNRANEDAEKSASKKSFVRDEELCLDEYLKKIPTALHNITLFSEDVPTLYAMVGAIYRGKNSVASTVRLEDHEQLCANKINELYEYYMRKVEEVEDYDVCGLLNTGFAKLTTAIIAGTAYDVEKQVMVNGVSEQMILDETDPVKKQKLIDQREGKFRKAAPKKATGRVEMLPEWFEDAATHWKKVEEKRKAEEAAKYAGMSEEEELKAIYANVADFIGITFEEFKAQQLEEKTTKQEVAQIKQVASVEKSEEEDLEAAAARVRAKLGLS